LFLNCFQHLGEQSQTRDTLEFGLKEKETQIKCDTLKVLVFASPARTYRPEKKKSVGKPIPCNVEKTFEGETGGAQAKANDSAALQRSTDQVASGPGKGACL
jgi:hypothetical protein